MTEKELFQEFKNSDYSMYKNFTDFLLNKINVLDSYNKMLLQSDTDKSNKIAFLSRKVNDLQKEYMKAKEKLANINHQL